jgi:pyruvate carboxylase
MIPVAEMMDDVGYWAMEVWGGATFDTMHRFLNEDPWERIRTLKRYVKKTPFSMLLRAQNLVGYRNYADDVAKAFVERTCENGMDIFRTFDALNDYRNFETVVPVIKEYGKEQPPQDVNPRTLQDAAAEQALIKRAKAGLLVEKSDKSAPDKSERARTFNVFVDDDYFEVAVDEVGGSPVVSYVQPMATGMPMPAAAPPAAPAAAVEGTPLSAPMPGMIVKYEKEVSDSVSQGETVVVLEAMKMENALPAPASGTVKSVNFSSGDSVAKGDVLAVIG